MTRTIALTGAGGFIGRYVAASLRRRGLDVRTVGIGAGSSVHADLYAGEFPKIEAEALLHLAWDGLPRYGDDVHTRQLPAHIAFLESALRSGVGDLTVAGTCFEYGLCEGRLEEDRPCAPVAHNKYAVAKDALRRALEPLCAASGATFKWVRFFYVYGEGQRSGSLYSQLRDAAGRGERAFRMSGGQQRRDFIPVAEAAENFVEIAMQRRVLGVVNNCRGEPVRVRDFVDQQLAAWGIEMTLDLGYYPYPEGEPFSFWGSTDKLRQAKEAFDREHGF
jgi:nucleoside-diphosphate-sugar epimerase